MLRLVSICVPNPSCRVLRRQIDTDASSLNRPLVGSVSASHTVCRGFSPRPGHSPPLFLRGIQNFNIIVFRKGVISFLSNDLYLNWLLSELNTPHRCSILLSRNSTSAVFRTWQPLGWTTGFLHELPMTFYIHENDQENVFQKPGHSRPNVQCSCFEGKNNYWLHIVETPTAKRLKNPLVQDCMSWNTGSVGFRRLRIPQSILV